MRPSSANNLFRPESQHRKIVSYSIFNNKKLHQDNLNSSRTHNLQRRRVNISIVGSNSDPELEFISQQSAIWCNNKIDTTDDLHSFSDLVHVEIIALHETHFQYVLKDLKRKSPQVLNHSQNSPLILIDNMIYVENLLKLVGFFIFQVKLPKEMFIRSMPYQFNQQHDLFVQLTQMTHSKLLQLFNLSESFVYVFFDIQSRELQNSNLFSANSIGKHTQDNRGGSTIAKPKRFRIIIQLNAKMLPKTCLNFYQLCEGNFKTQSGQRLSYKNTRFHACQKNAFIQGGAFPQQDESIFGRTFEDESYALKHDQPGVVGMANQGAPHSNASQFYITLSPQPDKDHKYVAFGLVVYGMKILRKINKLSAISRNNSLIDAKIVDCGEYFFQKDDFLKDSRKEFDLLDNDEAMDAKMVKSTSELINKNKINSTSILMNEIDQQTTQITQNTSNRSSNSSFDFFNFRKKYESQNQQKQLNSSNGLIQNANLQRFDQYKRENIEHPLFTIQSFNFLSERDHHVSANGNFNHQKTSSRLKYMNLRDKPAGTTSNLAPLLESSFTDLDQFRKLYIQAPNKNEESLNPSGEFYLNQRMNLPAMRPNTANLNSKSFQNSASQRNVPTNNYFNQNVSNNKMTQKVSLSNFLNKQQNTLQDFLQNLTNSKPSGMMFKTNTNKPSLDRQGSQLLQDKSSLKNISSQMLDEVSLKMISATKQDIGSLIIFSQINNFRKFIEEQYEKNLVNEQMQELIKVIPNLSESVAMQLPISLKKSLSQTAEKLFINKNLLADIQTLRTDSHNTFVFASKMAGFEESEVEEGW